LEKNINHRNGKQIIMAREKTFKIVGNYSVELGDKILMIKDLQGNLLKAESVKAFESEDKFKELCERLEQTIKDRVAAGKKV
jgi:selenophosphate synthetase-related protein